VLLSTVLTGAAVSHAFYTRKHFYNASIYMTTNKLNIVVSRSLVIGSTVEKGETHAHAHSMLCGCARVGACKRGFPTVVHAGIAAEARLPRRSHA
jgi:hypothetical protein